MPLLPAHAIPPEAASLAGNPLRGLLWAQQGPKGPNNILAMLCMMRAMEVDMAPMDGPSPLACLVGGERAPPGAPIEGRRAPLSLDDAEAHPGFLVDSKGNRTLALDPDWLGMWMVRMGADPWREEPYQWPSAIIGAACNGYEGVVRAAFTLPQAMPATGFATQQVDSKPLWQHIVSSKHGAGVWKALVEAGIDPHGIQGCNTHPLAVASIQVARLYAHEGWWPTDKKVLDRVQGAWQRRFSSGDVGHTAFRDFSDLMAGALGATQEERYQQILEARVGRMLLTSPDETAKSTATFQGVSRWRAEEMARVAQVAKGPWRGQWPVWAAMAAASGRGGLPLLPAVSGKEVAALVKQGKDRYFRLEGGTVPDLSSQVGMEWRDGVEAVGWLAYAVEVNALSKIDLGAYVYPKKDRKVADMPYWTVMGKAFGVTGEALRDKAMAALPGLAVSMLRSGLSGMFAKDMLLVGIRAANERGGTSTQIALGLLEASLAIKNDGKKYPNLRELARPLLEQGGTMQAEALWCMAWSPSGSREFRNQAKTELCALMASGVAVPPNAVALHEKSKLDEDEKKELQDLLVMAQAAKLAQVVPDVAATDTAKRPRL